jgi:hypothetical protein
MLYFFYEKCKINAQLTKSPCPSFWCFVSESAEKILISGIADLRQKWFDYLMQKFFEVKWDIISFLSSFFNASFNYFSAGLGFPLYNLGADPTENTVSLVIAQKSLDCCLFIHYRGNLFTESLSSNESLFWLRYPGFQTSCHSILHIIYFNSVL